MLDIPADRDQVVSQELKAQATDAHRVHPEERVTEDETGSQEQMA